MEKALKKTEQRWGTCAVWWKYWWNLLLQLIVVLGAGRSACPSSY